MTRLADEMEHKPHIKRNGFEIKTGASLHIQVGQHDSRMESTLVGIRQGKYLLITMPTGPHPSIEGLDEEGTPLIVRYIHKGNVYGFKSSILNVVMRPEKLLAIYYPAQVEVYELRNYPRLSCFLPARVTISKQVIDGSVIDISKTGAQYRCSAGQDIDQLREQIGETLQLEVQLPGSDGYTHIEGNLRNVSANSNVIELGIRFDKIDNHQLKNLFSFLLDAHALPEHQMLSGIIQKHYAWREQVFKFICADGDEEQNFALSPNECDMGKWLHTEGKAQYGGTDEFQELDKIHTHLHSQVETAVNLRLKGNKEASIEFLNQLNIGHISNRMAALLIAADENQIEVEEVATPEEETTPAAGPDTQLPEKREDDS